MKRYLVSLIIFLSLLPPANAQQRESEQLRVGAILPLSGELAFVGQEMQRGMHLALDQLQREDITLSVEDDQTFQNKQAVSAAHKLLNQDNVTVLLNSVVNTSPAIAPLLSQSGTAGIVLWDSNKRLASMSSHLFGFGFSTEQAGEDMAEHAYRELRQHRIAVVSAHDEWSEIISAAFVERFTEIDGEIVLHDRVNVSDTDLRQVILKLKARGADAVYAPLYAQSLTSFIRQARTLGFTGKILTADGFSQQELEMLGDLTEGIELTQLWLDSNEFTKRYEQRYGASGTPINIAFAAIGYDVIQVVALTLDRLVAKKLQVNRENFRAALSHVRHTGYTGTTDFGLSRLSTKKFPILTVQDGSFAFAR